MTTKRVIGLIAGNGEFPVEVAHAIKDAGHAYHVFGLRGFFSRALRQFPFASIDMLDPTKSLEILRAVGVTDIVLAGGVHRPGPSALLSIYSAFRNRDDLKKLLSGGDDRLLRGVVSFFEDHGFKVLSIGDVAPSLLAPVGLIGSVHMPDHISRSVDRALELLHELGRFDVGQGVVIAGERVLAIEGPEGTDAMLQRVKNMQKAKRVKLGDEPALLVKIAKPDQDRRVDLPAIGPKTIHAVKAVGLSGIVVAAHDVVIVERKAMIAAANRNGIFVIGVKVP